MLKEYKMQAILGVWGGVLLFFVGYAITSFPEALYAYFGQAIMLGASILFVCGCFMYSKGKGRSWYFGLFGFLGPLGLLVLYCLKDRSKLILKKREKKGF